MADKKPITVIIVGQGSDQAVIRVSSVLIDMNCKVLTVEENPEFVKDFNKTLGDMGMYLKKSPKNFPTDKSKFHK